MDLFSRKPDAERQSEVVGWAMSETMPQELTLAALNMAVTNRKPGPGLLHHSDRGSQGGFTWSSQHPDAGGCDGWSRAAFGPIWAGTISVARPSAGGGTG